MGAVQVTSKYGQNYQCTFPDHAEEEKRKEEEEKIAIETGIVEMLKPLGTKNCLFKVFKRTSNSNFKNPTEI